MSQSAYVNIAEAKARLSELVDRALRGEEIVIARDHKPVARLTAIHRHSGRRAPGTAKGQVWMGPNFDELLPDFAEYEQ